MPVINLEGRRIHYAEHGSGERAVVFLHGGFGSSSELWARTAQALPAGWRGYAIDNFLRSDPPPEGYSVRAFARRAGLFADALGLQRPVLAGHSMGGVVCQIAGIDYGVRLGGLALVCTGPSMTNHELGKRLLADLARDGPDALRAISAHWFRHAPADFFGAYVERACAAPLSAMIAVQESMIATDLRPALGQIRIPTLVVFGHHDTGRTRDHAEALLAGIAGSRLAEMHDSGHTPMIETPAAFDAAFHGFLRQIEAAAALRS
jgi:pimeloyl-ACP methyl ester carboxylesterase